MIKETHPFEDGKEDPLIYKGEKIGFRIVCKKCSRGSQEHTNWMERWKKAAKNLQKAEADYWDKKKMWSRREIIELLQQEGLA